MFVLRRPQFYAVRRGDDPRRRKYEIGDNRRVDRDQRPLLTRVQVRVIERLTQRLAARPRLDLDDIQGINIVCDDVNASAAKILPCASNIFWGVFGDGFDLPASAIVKDA